MNEINKGGLGFLFLYIGIALALVFTVVSGIQAVFGIVDHLVFSDSVGWYQLHRSTDLPFSAAFLFVSFISLYVVLRKMRSVKNDYRDTIWYTLCRAIILVIITASVVMAAVAGSFLVGDVFSGDVSLHAFLQKLFVIGVGAMVFYYYRGVLHGVWRDHKKEEKVFVFVVSVLVALIVLTATIISNPFERMKLEKTYETFDHVLRVDNSIKAFYIEENRLPTSLDEAELLKYSHGEYFDIVDVSYEVVNKTGYRLCASFDMLPRGTDMRRYPYSRFEIEETGESCFDLTL